MAEEAEDTGEDADGGEADGRAVEDGPEERRIGDITIEAATAGKWYTYMLSGGKFMLAGIIVTLAFLVVRFPLMVFLDALGRIQSALTGFLAAVALLLFIAFFILFAGWVVHTMWEWE